VEVRKDHFKQDIEKVCSSIDFALRNQAILRSKIEKAVIKAKRDAMIQIEDLAKDMISQLD